jgi:hypothetical protein
MNFIGGYIPCKFFLLYLLCLLFFVIFKTYLFGSTLSHFCACSKPGPGFSMSYVMVFFVFSEWRWEVIVRFVDIYGIVYHHSLNILFSIPQTYPNSRGRRGHDHMVVRFTTNYAMSAYHHSNSEFKSHSWWDGVLDTTLCDKVC